MKKELLNITRSAQPNAGYFEDFMDFMMVWFNGFMKEYPPLKPIRPQNVPNLVELNNILFKGAF